MLKTVEGDLLEIPRGILCHQVNCMGAMGAGLALQVKRKWPLVYEAYMQNYKQGLLRLGKLFLVKVGSGLYVANLCGQHHYGRNRQHTDYNALKKCFVKLSHWRILHHNFTGEKLEIFIPHKMGCSLGGGDWEVVSKLIEESAMKATIVKRR